MSDDKKELNRGEPSDSVKLRRVGGSVVATQPDPMLKALARFLRVGIEDLVNTDIEYTIVREPGKRIPYLEVHLVTFEHEEAGV